MSEIKFTNDINPSSLSGTTIVIDGSVIKNETDFLNTIWQALKFPVIAQKNWNSYLDWVKDLSWFKSNTVNLVIQNFGSFLSESLATKKRFIDDMNNIVIPYWKNETINISNEECAVSFNVYCIESVSTFVNTQKLIGNIQRSMLNGKKIPHNVSQPVIRKEDGKYYIASFVFFYTEKELGKGMINRPTMWALSDLETGKIIKRYYTKDKEFSDAPYGNNYSLAINLSCKNVQAYYADTFRLFDEIRKEIINTGNLDKEKYNIYLNRVKSYIPESYKRFFTDLSVNF